MSSLIANRFYTWQAPYFNLRMKKNLTKKL
jgi:hypothetical protein